MIFDLWKSKLLNVLVDSVLIIFFSFAPSKNWSSLAKRERKETAIGKYLYYFLAQFSQRQMQFIVYNIEDHTPPSLTKT